jgi:hypothetical protein
MAQILADCLLGSRVRITLGARMFLSCDVLCCRVSVEAFAMSLSPVQRSSTECLNKIKKHEKIDGQRRQTL